jgi:broad specificity phosphatase PhoE
MARAVPAMNFSHLRHRYFAVRHGFSVPNELKVIVSSLDRGVETQYGLAPKGIDQAVQLGHSLARQLAQTGDKSRVLMLVSPFSRAQETAQYAANVLRQRLPQLPLEIHTVEDLRERFFGDLELQPDSEYDKVWQEDQRGEQRSTYGAEHVDSVWRRVAALIRGVEEDVTAPTLVLLVAHGDILQITETAFRQLPLKDHRSIPHLHQAECREITGLPQGSAAPHKSKL